MIDAVYPVSVPIACDASSVSTRSSKRWRRVMNPPPRRISCSASNPARVSTGSATQVESVELQFPDGTKQTVANVMANQLIVVQEGKGLVAQGAPAAA